MSSPVPPPADRLPEEDHDRKETGLLWIEVPSEEEIIPRQKVESSPEPSSSDDDDNDDDDDDESRQGQGKKICEDGDDNGDGCSSSTKDVAKWKTKKRKNKKKLTYKDKGNWKEQPLSIIWCLKYFETQSPPTAADDFVVVYEEHAVYQQVNSQSQAANDLPSSPVAGPSHAGQESDRDDDDGKGRHSYRENWRKRRRGRRQKRIRRQQQQKTSSGKGLDDSDEDGAGDTTDLYSTDSVDSSPETYRRAQAEHVMYKHGRRSQRRIKLQREQEEEQKELKAKAAAFASEKE